MIIDRLISDHYSYVHMALSRKMRDVLENYAAECTDWKPGRQGTGYYKTDLTEMRHDLAFSRIINTALKTLDSSRSFKPGEFDAWLLYYPERSSIPPHRDPSPKDGFKHKRLNITLIEPSVGGSLIFTPDKSDAYYYEYVPMKAVGDGIIFYPSETEHAVSNIDQGHRLVFSVGILEPK